MEEGRLLIVAVLICGLLLLGLLAISDDTTTKIVEGVTATTQAVPPNK
jgi:hypothetical protein